MNGGGKFFVVFPLVAIVLISVYTATKPKEVVENEVTQEQISEAIKNKIIADNPQIVEEKETKEKEKTIKEEIVEKEKTEETVIQKEKVAEEAEIKTKENEATVGKEKKLEYTVHKDLTYPLEPIATMNFAMKHPYLEVSILEKGGLNMEGTFSIPPNIGLDNVKYEGVYETILENPVDNITFTFKMKSIFEDGQISDYAFSMQEKADKVVFYIQEGEHSYWGYYDEEAKFIRMEY